MNEGTKKLLWVGGGLAALFTAYVAGRRHGFRQGAQAQAAIAPAPTPPQVTQASTISAPTVVPLSLVPGNQAVSVPTGAQLQVFPPDANSSLLSFSTASGSVTSITNASGPQTFTIRGSGSITVTWQDASKAGRSTVIAVTAT